MAIFLLHAARDEAPAEALARACERRGMFVEVETGRRAGRPFKPEDHCVAILSGAEAADPLSQARRLRAFDASTQAKLSVLPLGERLFLPFGWRDLDRLTPPELGGAWGELAATLHAVVPYSAPAEAGPEKSPEQNRSELLGLGAPLRKVAVITCKSTMVEAESLKEALHQRGMRGWIGPADAPGPQIGSIVGDMDMAAILLSAEAGANDGARRWLHAASRIGLPVLGVMVDDLWQQAPLADFLGKSALLALNRLPGERRGAQFAARCRALPRRRKSRGRA